MSENNMTDFDVQYLASQIDDDTVLVTTAEQIDAMMEKRLFAAVKNYDISKEMYSAKFSQNKSSTALTTDRISELADGINTTLSQVTEVARYARKYTLTDDIMGATYQAIQNNINTEYHLTFGSPEGRNKQKQLKDAKKAIEQFNKSVNLEGFIAEAVPQTILDGNYVCYLRTDGGNAVIDVYPLGIAEITDYTVNGNPVVQINLKEFKDRLKKPYTKDKKGRALYFENVDKEIQRNFPPEVYQAYQNGETYCRLDWRRTGVLRINNMGYKYGVSHFFRAMRPAVMLDEIEEADSINNKAKAKKILHQKLRKEVMGPSSDYSRKGFDIAMYAHKELAAAWQNKTVLYTSIPAVEDISYVEPKVDGTPTEKIALYRNEKMTALGITFLDPTLNSVSSANISLKQLMKTVDFVARQINRMMERFYAVWLEENGIDLMFTPEVRILNSEEMDMGMRIELARFLFNEIGVSHATALNKLGLDVDDEAAKRIQENAEGFVDIFAPHASAYTSSGSSTGRPAGTDPEAQGKQAYDKNYNENNR